MLHKHDLPILVATIILSLLGLFTLISTNIDLDGNIDLGGIVVKQVIFLLTGFLFYFGISRLDYTYLKHLQVSGVIYLVTIILLIITLIWGPLINNVQRWLIVGGIQIQASEVAKLTVIIMTAGMITLKYKHNEWILAISSFLLLIPIIVLIYIEPHGAMSLIMLLLWFFIIFTFMDNQLRNALLLLIVAAMATGIMIFVLGERGLGVASIIASLVTFIFGMYTREQWQKLFLGALVLGLALGVIGSLSWNRILKEYQRDRIEAFLNPDEVDTDKKFNVDQAKIAIGSGGFWGKGFGYGTQSRLHFLPEHQTDFIFATYAEQFGLIGSLFLLTVYGYLIARILLLGANLQDDFFGSILAIGIGVKLLIEVFINIGTNTGAIPATGIPLPLLSAGGSVTIMTFISLGIIQSIIIHKKNEPDLSDLVDNKELLL